MGLFALEYQFGTFSPILSTKPHLDASSRQTLQTDALEGCDRCGSMLAPCLFNDAAADLENNPLLFEKVGASLSTGND
jgi:hypothetical protein